MCERDNVMTADQRRKPVEIVLDGKLDNVPGSMRARWPWDRMEIGDWFVVPVERSSYQNMIAAARYVNKRRDAKFAVEGIGGHGNKSISERYGSTKVTRVA